MRNSKTFTFAMLAALPLALPSAASAASGTTASGVRWQAQSNIVGVTSTGTNGAAPGGYGDAIYLATAAKYRGTVGLLIQNSVGAFVCSGSLSANRQAIITAAHCVSDGGLGRPNSVTAFFYDGGATNGNVYNPATPGITQVAIGSVHVNPLYSGQVIDQNDIAVLRLAGAAPTYANGYEILTAGDLTGLDFNVAGYGGRSNVGGNAGVSPASVANVGRLRQGDNRFDFALGDADFGGFFTDLDANGKSFFDDPMRNNRHGDATFSYIADFDNGLAANDGSCQLATLGLGIAASGKYCNLGLGAREVTTAGGDSGGPQFINGKLASVTSYGLTFGSDFGDIDNRLNDTFGEYAGYVPTFIHANWIAGVVPEPATWAMMIAGFGLVGGAVRRRKVSFATA
jgi:V8-like Glu-specific endopeptidase